MNSLKNYSGTHKVCSRAGIVLTNIFFLNVFSFAIFFFPSCSPPHDNIYSTEKSKQVAEEISPELITDTINGSTHNFIRKADIKCKVKDVLQSTKNIESITTLAGGYITNSDLSSVKDYSNNIRYKKDSIMESTYYTTIANLTLRVPNKKLDSVLSKITDMALYIDNRTVIANDVKLKLLSGKMAENRYKQFQNNLKEKTAHKESKPGHIQAMEESLLEKQELKDDKKIESLDLIDQVNYSTVVLTLYQPRTATHSVVAMPTVIESYETPFINKLGSSFVNGFEILKDIILFLINFWGLFLILISIFFFVRKLIINYSKKQTV